jgi:hypothetical protein
VAEAGALVPEGGGARVARTAQRESVALRCEAYGARAATEPWPTHADLGVAAPPPPAALRPPPPAPRRAYLTPGQLREEAREPLDWCPGGRESTPRRVALPSEIRRVPLPLGREGDAAPPGHPVPLGGERRAASGEPETGTRLS